MPDNETNPKETYYIVSGFGVFKISERSAREGRNPQTGEKIKIAASKSVSFKAGTELKTKIN